MRLLTKLRNLLRNLLRRGEIEQDLREELRSHLQLLTDQNLRAGMPAEEARRGARLELGGIEQVQEHVRDDACYLPARRACVVDPVVTLRYE